MVWYFFIHQNGIFGIPLLLLTYLLAYLYIFSLLFLLKQKRKISIGMNHAKTIGLTKEKTLDQSTHLPGFFVITTAGHITKFAPLCGLGTSFTGLIKCYQSFCTNLTLTETNQKVGLTGLNSIIGNLYSGVSEALLGSLTGIVLAAFAEILIIVYSTYFFNYAVSMLYNNDVYNHTISQDEPQMKLLPRSTLKI